MYIVRNRINVVLKKKCFERVGKFVRHRSIFCENVRKFVVALGKVGQWKRNFLLGMYKIFIGV